MFFILKYYYHIALANSLVLPGYYRFDIARYSRRLSRNAKQAHTTGTGM